jgi:hypothetical protein
MSAGTDGYPVCLAKAEARLLLGMLTNPAYQNFTDYDETVVPLIEKLRAVLLSAACGHERRPHSH